MYFRRKLGWCLKALNAVGLAPKVVNSYGKLDAMTAAFFSPDVRAHVHCSFYGYLSVVWLPQVRQHTLCTVCGDNSISKAINHTSARQIQHSCVESFDRCFVTQKPALFAHLFLHVRIDYPRYVLQGHARHTGNTSLSAISF